jgi:hypothetical protein
MIVEINIPLVVANLLKTYDCVIIPNFGGFVGNYEPAKISPSRQKILPPSKAVFFNKNLTKNDGLLATEIANKNAISYAEALKNIEKFVAQINKSLAQGNRINFTPIGDFSFDKKANIIKCEINKEYNFLGNAFGLHEMMMPIVEKNISADLKSKYKHNFETKTAKKSFIKKYWPRAAAMPFALFMIVYPFKNNIEEQSLGFLNHSKETALYSPRSEWKNMSEVYLWSEDLNTELTAIATISELKEEKVEEVKVEAKKSIEKIEEKASIIKTYSENQFYIVAGSFGVEKNALAFAEKLKSKGYNASVFDNTGGMYRVAYNQFSSREEAVNQLIEINKDLQAAAWIMEK